MFCKFCGNKLLENSRFCHECGRDNSSIPQESKQQVQAAQFNNLSEYKISQKRNNKHLKIFGIIAGSFLSILLIILIVGIFINRDSNMKLENPVTIANDIIEPSGGKLVIKSSDLLNGFTIEVPQDAYSSDQIFKISSSVIKSHNFGKYFNPVTPLITIDNNHEFSKIPMTVSIPIEKEDDEFALAFYYDKATNKLEAIPFISLTNDNITIVTSHFSDIVVSKIKLEEIQKLAFSPDNKIDTGFSPGIDDWQFTNYGSFIAPKGHCGGQAITMAWYYSKKFKENDYPRLFGAYDNNSYSLKTPDFWYDDSQGYRFASVIQNSISWDKVGDILQMRDNDVDYRTTFNAFAYSMLITGEPQLMAIYRRENQVNIQGHAITVYKIENGKIYVADPNYPGQTDRFVGIYFYSDPIYESDYDDFFSYDDSEASENDNQSSDINSETQGDSDKNEVIESLMFENYSSGANAADIKEKGVTLYNRFYFMGQSAIVDYAKIEREYENMLNRSAGNDTMPAYNVYYLSDVDPKDPSQRTFTQLIYDLELKKGYDDSFPEELKGKIVLMINSEHKSVDVDVFRNMNSPAKMNEESLKPEADGNIVFALDLNEGENNIGLLINGIPQNFTSSKYIDFNWIKIDYVMSENKENPTPTPESSSVPGKTVLSQGSGPENYHLGAPTYTNVTSGDAQNNDRLTISIYGYGDMSELAPVTKTPAYKVSYEEIDSINRKIIIEISCASAETQMGYYGGGINNLGYVNWVFKDNKLTGYISLRDDKNVDVKVYIEKENFITIDFIGK